MSQPFLASQSQVFTDLWHAQLGICALCDQPMLQNRFEAPHARIWAKQRATFDHIVPKSKGGSDSAENLQLTHARCNKIKGNQT